MLIIIWRPTGFAVVTALQNVCKFNAGYYVSKVLTPLSECLRERGGGDSRKLIVYGDSASLHKAAMLQQFLSRWFQILT
jgi:hypothetical protein